MRFRQKTPETPIVLNRRFARLPRKAWDDADFADKNDGLRKRPMRLIIQGRSRGIFVAPVRYRGR
jgi:hypothetical protein